MYIKTNDQTYPCVGYAPQEGHVSFLLGVDAPESLGPTVELCQDDGFILAAHTVGDFARHEGAGRRLTLTNRPIPAPADPEPEEPELPTPTVQEAMLDMLADLDERVGTIELAALAAAQE